MAAFVNDGNINWTGNWQTTGKVDALHASTGLVVDSGQTRYSVYWAGNASNTDFGVLAYMTAENNAGTITATLESANDTAFTDTLTAEQTSTFIIDSTTLVASGNWFFFKLSTTEAESATKYYRYKFTSNSTADTTFRADGTDATKVATIQVLSATGTLAAGSVVYVVGNANGATGLPADAAVTVDVNSATEYGAIDISTGGILKWNDAASQTVSLDVAGNITIRDDGTFQMGTSAAAIPSTTTARLRMTLTSDGQYGIIKHVYSNLTVEGASKTYFKTILSGDIAAGLNTSFTTTDSTGWAVGDVLLLCYSKGNLASSTDELVTITGISGTTIYLDTNGNGTGTGVDIGNHHGHEAPQGIVCNMTRNVTITAKDATYEYYIRFQSSSANTNAYFNWCVLSELGGAANYSRGLCPSGNVGNFGITGMNGAVIRDCNNLIGSNSPGWSCASTFQNLVFYNNASGFFQCYSTMTYQVSFIDCVFCKNPTGGNASGNPIPDAGSPRYPYILTNVDIITETSASGELYLWNFPHISNNCTLSNVSGGTGVTMISGNDIRNDFYNCKFNYYGGSNPYRFLATVSNPTYHFYNCLIDASITVTVATYRNYNYPMVFHQNYQQVAGRYLAWAGAGSISDQITAGYTAAYARGGSGYCVCINPNSTTIPLYWEFYIPVAASSTTLSFYITKTTAFTAGTVNVDIYDSDDNITLLRNDDSITLASIPTNDGTGDDWTYQWTSTAFTPTQAGFCRVVIKVKDGSTTGDILIDDVTVG